jgi:two-component system NtrC family sensor kinase
MIDENKTNEQLIHELMELRKKVDALSSMESALKEFSVNLVQNLAAPTFVLDNGHRVILWNRACEELTGIKAADIVGTDEQWKPFYSHKRPVLADIIIDSKIEDLPLLYHTYAKSKFIPEGLQAEGWYPSIKGVERYISFNAAPIRNSMGELIASIETFEDLTEIKRTEKKLIESEKRYRTLFEGSPAVMLVIDPVSAEIVAANEAAIHFYGYSREELTGKPMTEIIALPGEQVLQMLRETIKGPLYIHLQHRLASGEIRDVELSRGPISVDGTTYLFSIIHDITARKEAEETIRESENKLQAITSLATDAIILINNEGKIAYWNIAAEKMFGYDDSEMMGKDLDTVIPPQYKDAHKKGFARFAETGVGPMIGKIYEVSAIRKDGLEFPIELSISGLLLKGKWNSAGVVRDITGRRNLETQLRQAQKMEAIGTLAGGVAHDFNNILTAIIGFASLLTMKMAKSDPLLHEVNQILDAADRATTLTQSLLAFSRKTPIDTKPVNLNDIINKVEKLLVRLLREDIELKSMLAAEELTVMADPGQIEQVLINLVTNARDAMPKGGQLRISTEILELDQEFIRAHGYGTPGRYASLICSDNGSGMDKETAQRIFEPFFTTKETGKGTGLGLAIVYGIVQQHKGYINCYSEPGKGTTFRMYMPLTPTLTEEARELPEISHEGGDETILVAEDDAAARDLIRQVLETFGYKVVEAVDGEDAVTKFVVNKDDIKLVILDVIMPRKNGKEACENILQLEPNMKCLFISGYAADIFDEGEKKLLHFLPKPIFPSMLLRKIREMLDS